MKEVTGKGPSLDEAINDALRQLNAMREEVEIEPLSTGSKGFLGLFGKKPASVKASLRPEDRILATVFVRNVLFYMNIDSSMNVKEDEENLVISLDESASPLIGPRGQTLDALQYLLSRFMYDEGEDRRKVTIDIDGYRDKRDDELREMAETMAKQVIESRRDQRTEPLNSSERRIVHMVLKENSEVTTFSIGDGPRKRIVIASNDKDARSADDRPRGERSGGGGGNRRRGGRGRGGPNRGGSGSGGGQRPQRPQGSGGGSEGNREERSGSGGGGGNRRRGGRGRSRGGRGRGGQNRGGSGGGGGSAPSSGSSGS